MTIHENETIIILRIEIGVPVLKAGMSYSDKALHKQNTKEKNNKNNNNKNISSD